MRKIDGPRPERNKPGKYKPTMREDSSKIERVRERIKQSRQERIAALETKKDRTSLKKELEFVGENRDAYRQHVETFFAKAEYPESRAFAEKITFPNYEKDKAQISPNEIKNIIARIPPHLVGKSSLISIDFEWQDKLPVPAFDSEGNLDFEKIQIMTAEDFIKSHHHPHRALIGYTQLSSETDESGEKTYTSVIKPTTIPETISDDPELVRFYQMHVLIHEFFHTIEGPYRNEDAARKWTMNRMSGRTFADWKTDYAKAVGEERIPGSYYASVYLDDLFRTSDQKPAPFGFPIREWICEDWVGTVMGIVPNSAENTDFRTRTLSEKDSVAPLGSLAKNYGEETAAGGLKKVEDDPYAEQVPEPDLGALRRRISRVGSRRHELIQELLTPEYQPEIRESFIKAIQVFAAKYGVPQQVCYPGSGDDTSLLRALPEESKITFIDPAEYSIRKVQTYEPSPRFTGIVSRAEDYAPPHPYDLVFGSSSSAGKHMIPHLKTGGHVMHEITYSSWTFDDERLKLVGVILRENPSSILSDEQTLQEYGEQHPDWEKSGKDEHKFVEMGHSYWGNNRTKKAEWYIFEKTGDK